MRYEFDEYVFDSDALTIETNRSTVTVQPQVADVLETLIEERERVVPKAELLDRVWGHRFVTESALTSRIKSARQAIGDSGRAQRLIRTIHGRGYQFIGEVAIDHTAHVASEGAPTSRLPTFATDLVGRELEIERVAELLDRSRLLTIVGTGGVGKTRLAVAVAGRREAAAVFVDLTVVRDASLVMPLIAERLGLGTDRTSARAAVVEYLQDRPTMLVVDNVEHVISAATELGSLVGEAPGLTVLATSREPLRVDGEVVFPLDPLETPTGGDDEVASVRLFWQTAMAVDPAFDPNDHVDTVAQICASVDGLPLAVELAAAQVRTLPPEELLPRLVDRLRSSATARRDVPDRHRTMTDTIDWSLQLLDDIDRAMFARLGVVTSPIPLLLIERICGDGSVPDPLDSLSRLVDRSLVRKLNAPDGSVRFVLLELLRVRARELLQDAGDDERLRDRHATAIADYIETERDRHWTGSAPFERVAELLSEARLAFEHARRRRDWELAARIASALTALRHRDGGHPEWRRWLGDVGAHRDVLTDRTRAHLAFAEGFSAWHHDEQDRARSRWTEAVARFEKLDEKLWTAYGLACLAMTHVGGADDVAVGRDLAARSILLAREAELPRLLTSVLIITGEFSRITGDHDTASERYLEARDVSAAIGDPVNEGVADANLSYVASHRGEFEAARDLGRRGLALAWRAGRRQMAAWSVSELAEPALGLGEYELGARLVGAAESALAAMGGRFYPGDAPTHEAVVAGLRDALGEQRYRREYACGARLRLDAAITLALGETARTLS